MSAADDNDELILKEHELNSTTWLRTREYLEARITRLRAKNDCNLTHDETTTLRGRIAELKKLLAAGERQD